MSKIFISHSSSDNPSALALADWLREEGWDDLFLDLDPERGIVAGERWERALHDAANRCDAVLFLVSSNWLSSEWCLREFDLAHRLNKRIFGVLIEELDIEGLPDKLTATWQLVNLAGSTDHEVFRAVLPDSGEERHVNFSVTGLKSLRSGLMRAGLDPRFFDWPPADDPDRAPYRGMRALEAEDAGIFFGREAPIIELLSELRGLRDDPPPRLLVILGASGAGKSSFVRAGLLPRLARDDRHFAVLPVIRPGPDALTGDDGLVAMLDQACRTAGLSINRATMRRQVLEGEPDDPQPLADTLRELSHTQRVAPLPGESDEGPPTLVIPIDQAEELFLAEGAEAADRFLNLIRALTGNEDVPLLVLMTIRSDSYEQLQTTSALEGIRPRLYPLAPMPQGNYQMVIEGPSRRLNEAGRKLLIEPQLTERLLGDIHRGGSKDALPLLAFTLERLYRDYGGDGDLRLDEYEDMGGINGAIDAAVEKALKAGNLDESLPSDRDALLSLLRRGLIPWLAGIDPDTQAPRRRIARASEIPDEARPIIDHLIAQRLLATDVNDEGETTIEPTHEALLRQWGRLKDWLEEDFAALTTLEALQRATRDWQANDQDDKYLVHHAGRLEDAEYLSERPDLDEALTRSDRAYLKACRKREDEERDRELKRARELAEAQARVAKRTRVGLVIALLLTAVAGLIGFHAYQQRGIAHVERDKAEHQAEVAENNLIEANHNFGLALVERAEAGSAVEEHQAALYYRLHAHSKLQAGAQTRNIGGIYSEISATPLPVWSSDPAAHHQGVVWTVAYSPDGTTLASGSWDDTIKLWNLSSGELLTTLEGHSDRIFSVAYSPDGTRLASGAGDNMIKLWDVASGELLTTLEGHAGAITNVAFSSDGTRLASGAIDETLKVWNLTNKELVTTLTGHSDFVTSAVFSSEGTLLASGAADNTIKLWDVASGEMLATLEGHTEDVNSIAFNPDGTQLASGSGDNTVKLWDVASAALLTTFEGHSDWVWTVAFNSDGSVLASGSSDKEIKLWDVSAGVLLNTLDGHSQQVNSVAFSPDSAQLVSGAADHTVRLWNVASGSMMAPLAGHLDEIKCVVFSPDGALLASASDDNTIKLWDTASGELLSTLEGHLQEIYSVDFTPDGAQLASGSWDDTIKLWDVETGALLTTLEGHSDGVTSVDFSPDGARLASGSWDDTIKLWDVETGALLSTLEGHLGGVFSVAFSPDGAWLASGSDDDSIKLWDATTSELVDTLRSRSYRVTTLAFSSEGTRLASGSSYDGTINLWDVAGSELLVTIEGHLSSVYSVAFSPDGRWLASGADDNTIRLWGVSTGALQSTLRGHSGRVRSVDFSSDGTRLASGSGDSTIKLWSVDSGDLLAPIEGHSGDVLSVAFRPDGTRLASGSADGTVKLWDRATGELLTTLAGHSGAVTSVAFSPNGVRLASGANDNTVKLWDAVSSEVLTTLEGHSAQITNVAFSPDGAQLASGAVEDTIMLWNVASGELQTTLAGHSDIVASLSFSPDGMRLASSGGDTTVNVWDVATGELAAAFEGHTEPVLGVAYSPDGTRLASGSLDKSTKIWDVTSGEQMVTIEGDSYSIHSLAFSPDGRWLASSSDDHTIRVWDVARGALLASLDGRSGNTARLDFSPDGKQLAWGSGDNTIKRWDARTLYSNSDDIRELLNQQRLLTGMRLDDLELIYDAPTAQSLFKREASTNRPSWREQDPLFWLPAARQGDTEAMIHAGNAFFRRKQLDQARHWFEQALAQGDERAEKRLELLDRAIDAQEQ